MVFLPNKPYISGISVEVLSANTTLAQPTCACAPVAQSTVTETVSTVKTPMAAVRPTEGLTHSTLRNQCTNAVQCSKTILTPSAPLVLPLWPYCDWWC